MNNSSHATAIVIMLMACLLFFAVEIVGQNVNFGFSATLGITGASGGVLGDFTAGTDVWFAFGLLRFDISYLICGRDYYYVNHATGLWEGPAPFSSVPDPVSADEWLFFQTRSILITRFEGLLPLSDHLFVDLGIGPAFSILSPSRAYDCYPGFAAAFDSFAATVNAYLGLSVRIGLMLALGDIAGQSFFLSAEYQFLIDSLVQLSSGDSSLFIDSSAITITIGFQLWDMADLHG